MMGAFDDLKWTYDGAFKDLFDLGLNGELEQLILYTCRKGMLHFDLTNALTP